MPHLFPDWWWRNESALAELIRSPLFAPGLLARWAAQNLLLSGAVWTADFLAGAAVLRALGRRGQPTLPPPLRAAASLAIGSGLTGLAMFLLGTVRLLHPAVPVALTAAAGLAGALVLHRLRARRWALSFARLFRPRRPGTWALAGGLLWAFLGIMLLAGLMLPIMEFDSTTYHMRAARFYGESTSVAYNGDFRYNAHPHLSVLLYLRQWSVVGEDGLAKLANIEYLLMIVLVLVYAAREWRWRGGWAAALLFVASSPLFLFIVQLEYADLALAAYFAVASTLLFHHLRRGGSASLAAGGLVLGFAGALKLQGLVLAACAMAGLAAGWLAARRGIAALVRALALVGGLVALSGAGWWMRSWVNTGSPAFPFFAGQHPDAVATFVVNRSYGLGHGLTAFLLLPWRMLVGPYTAFADPAVFGIAGLLLVAAAAAALAARRARPTPEVLFLAVTCAAFTLLWFRSGQVMRYLTSILALMAMLWMWLLCRVGVPRRRWLSRTIVCLLAVAAVYETLAMSMVFRRGVLPPVTYAQKEFALAGGLPYYPAVREINRRASPSEKTYLLFCEECGYYLKTASAGDWHGDYPYRWAKEQVYCAADLAARLRKAGFRWVLVSRAAARRSAGMFDWPFDESAFVRRDAVLPGATAVYSDNLYGAFQLW